MNFSDDLTADLPSPRDDEPASLRQDIVDELSDHLHCALQRELLASGGRQSPDTSPGASAHDTREQSAWQSVLTRFGNPAAVAYRLWWDAMKETIMTQRYTAFMATLAAAACVVMCVLFWQSSLRNSDVQQQLLQQQQELNQTLLGELKTMQTTSSTAATNAGWAPVSVRLQSAEGAPVAGRVKIAGTAINAGNDNKIDVSRTVDESGVADFGLLPFGNYDLKVDATAVGEEHNESFMLSPNTPAQLTIVCPTVLPPAVEVSFEIDVPEPLHADRLVFCAFFERQSMKTSSGWWSPGYSDGSFAILFDAEGRILGEPTNVRRVASGSSDFGRGQQIGFPIAFDHGGSHSPFEPVECRIGPVRTVRADDRCIGLAVGATLAKDTGGDASRHAVFSNVYQTDGLYFESLEDSDPVEDQLHLEFRPTTSFWTEIVRTFRSSSPVAEVTIPDGWPIVKVPTNAQRLMSLTAIRLQFSRGGSTAPSPVPPRFPPRMRVMVSLPGQEAPNPLPVGVGFGMMNSINREDYRKVVQSYDQIDLGLLVTPELAEAIELARKLGTLEAVPVPSDEGEPDDGPSVNQQTLEILQRLAAGGNE